MVDKELLAAVPLFSRCTPRELARVARVASRASAEAGDVIVEEGTAGDRFYVIERGSATVSLRGRELARLGPGSFFGEIALLDGLPRTATVTADTPTRLYTVGATDFARLLEESPSVSRAILRAVAQRLRAAEDAPTYATGRREAAR